jgi:hypothetical protein
VVHSSSDAAPAKLATELFQGDEDGERPGRSAGVEVVDTCDSGGVAGGQMDRKKRPDKFHSGGKTPDPVNTSDLLLKRTMMV